MAEISIGNNHKAQIQAKVHVVAWLQAEMARLQSALQHITEAGQREQAELVSFLAQVYGAPADGNFRIDADRGVIIVPDPPAPATPVEPEPKPEPAAPEASQVRQSAPRAAASSDAKSDNKTLARLHVLNAQQQAETTTTTE